MWKYLLIHVINLAFGRNLEQQITKFMQTSHITCMYMYIPVRQIYFMVTNIAKGGTIFHRVPN